MASRELRVAVIGARASGIMAAIKRHEAGNDDIAVFDKAASRGGAWRDNTCPGLTCDAALLAYRHSFAPNSEWTRLLARSRNSRVPQISRGASRRRRADPLQERGAGRVRNTDWATGCRSWYIDRQGRVASWPWSYEKFLKDMSAPVLADFEIA
jgi:cation diffusion facilitator CzcD-associated flavoprotein CzcO